MNSFLQALKDKFRASSWLWIGLALLSIVAVLNAAKIGVAIWLAAKLCVGAYVGYWIDRVLHPYARPHTLEETDERAFRYLVRAVIVGCALIAAGLQA